MLSAFTFLPPPRPAKPPLLKRETPEPRYHLSKAGVEAAVRYWLHHVHGEEGWLKVELPRSMYHSFTTDESTAEWATVYIKETKTCSCPCSD